MPRGIPNKKVEVEEVKKSRGRPPKVVTEEKPVEKKTTSKASTETYDASKIKELPFPDNVRTRPEMYVGRTNKSAQLTCLREIVNNSVDEYLAGFASEITVIRHNTRQFTVVDNGRGVPFDKHSSGKNVMEVIFGSLHAGRNFEAKTVYSTGLNGVGASCVNALSESFVVFGKRDKQYGLITFNSGKKVSVVTKDITSQKDTPVKTKNGTAVVFKLEDSLFEEELTHDDIKSFLQEVAFVCNDLKIKFIDESIKDKKEFVFHYTNKLGLSEYIKHTLKDKKAIFEPVVFSETIKDKKKIIIKGEEQEVDNTTIVEVALTYDATNSPENIASFCNTIRTSQGGSHVTGFKRALSQNLAKYIKDNNLSKIQLDPEDFRPGLNVAVSVYNFNPKYTSQTKQELDMSDVSGFVIKACNNGIKDWMASNPKIMKILAEMFSLNAKGRLAQKRALENVRKENSSFISSMSSMRKFSDSIEHGENSELFIVEG